MSRWWVSSRATPPDTFVTTPAATRNSTAYMGSVRGSLLQFMALSNLVFLDQFQPAQSPLRDGPIYRP